MVKFPLKFESEVSSPQGIATTWQAKADQLAPIQCSIPPEFMGPGGGYSPEDLFGLSLLSCLIATFKVYAEKSNITFQEIKGKVSLTVDKVPSESAFVMTQADITLDLIQPSNAEKAKQLLEAAIRDCAVSRSIKTGKTFHINIS